jgi:pentatricopeptide repeat protein
MLADDSRHAVDCWQFFLEHFGPDAWRKGSIDRKSSPSYLYIRDGSYSGRALLKRIIRAKDDDPFSTTLPAFTEVTTVYAQLGILHGPDWADMMFSLIERILKYRESPSKDDKLEDMLISDLVGSWNVVFRQLGKNQHPVEGPPFDWSHVPPISSKNAIQAYRKRGIQGCFALLTPSFSFHHIKDIPVIAVATFTLLTQGHISEKKVVQEAATLVSSLGQVISVLSTESRPTAETRELAAETVEEFVKTAWSETKELAARMDVPPATKTPSSTPSHMSTRMSSTFIHRRLQDAFVRRDGHEVDRLWGDMLKLPVKQESTTDPEFQTSKNPQRGFLSVGICNYFILTYMALRQPSRAIDVWNYMVKSGLVPNLATWDSMMTGCKTSRDAKALENVWAKMLALRVQPDVVCWTTRISGLIECNQFDKAMRALDEMGRLWLAAARSKHGNLKVEELQHVDDVEGAIKPTTSTINAAISGLLKKHKVDAAHRILAWAGKFAIRPDIITYNTLLRSVIRNGQTQEAMALLQQMQDDGLEADVATFTTILDETFRYFDENTPEEQKEIIATIFSEMESAGVKANLHTYGKIIYHLLEREPTDLTAVNAVVERMARQGLQPSPYISTMLVEYYFSRQPPDLDAVRVLIERSRMEPASVDNIFWDRVIEGYSRVGDTTSAVRILGKVNSGSSRISWTTLQKLLSSLVQNEEWDVARTLVRNAKIDSGGPLPEHVHGKKDQHRFWRLVAELELLDA